MRDRYVRHLEMARDFGLIGDVEKHCQELGFALQFLKTRFTDIQQEVPNNDWVDVLRDNKSLFEDTCITDDN